MLEWILQKLELLGAPAGWITSLIQLFIWVIGGTKILRRCRKLLKEKNEKLKDIQEEISKANDRAAAWHSCLKEALRIAKSRAPTTYQLIIEPWGGEEKIANWWYLPQPPIYYANAPEIEFENEENIE